MKPYIHRDLSWLDFNYRVLQEAKDKRLPLLERLKFIAIYSSNLDEFFKVRVANHRYALRTGKKTRAALGFEPDGLLEKILKKVNLQQEELSKILEDDIIKELAKHKINIYRRKKLNEEQIEFIENYFNENMLPFVQPVLLLENKIKPFLNTGALYLTLQLRDKATKKPVYALAKIPSDHLPRFIELPPHKKGARDIIILDDIVRHNVRHIFPGYHILDTYSIKLTRDAELYIGDEYTGDLISKIKKSLKRRNIGNASRMVFDREMPKDMLDYLSKVFDLHKYDKLPEGRYHNNADFFKFPQFGMKHLLNPPQPPLHYPLLENTKNIFEAIKEKDHLIHVPYQSYQSVIKFFEDAAVDPDVTHIKIIQYRVAKVSRIMDALKKAVKNGKQVSAFIEVKARFDEEANLAWGEKLEKAGATVHYSMPGLKVHSKLAMVRREEENGYKLYCYLSTGNFHEETAKIYSDLGIFTADPRLTKEAARLFSYLETKVKSEKEFKYLAVGQFNLLSTLKEAIKHEIHLVEQGKKGKIFLKMNSISEKGMIDLLYSAAQKGVKIKMVIRGICSLVPGIKGISENISGISIVDRYLEHARVFIFGNDGDPKVFLSSADWMERNLYRRIETIFPILDPEIKKTIIHLMDIQWHDNVKARYIHYKKNNQYYKSNDDILVRAQTETYLYIKRRTVQLLEEAKNKEKKIKNKNQQG